MKYIVVVLTLHLTLIVACIKIFFESMQMFAAVIQNRLLPLAKVTFSAYLTD